ncbi:hypothetical protein OG271_10200 [Micromonospora rifamycinica]|uniref:hypothetical protein n=1 Tax=Micromonospora rifamycinica TaxID=291594 RepID=UPI002E2D0D95|nr:hypothetical protein [Micromonospora rifamycinica]
MELYPGSEVVSEDTIRIAPGIELSIPANQPRGKRVLSREEVEAALAVPNSTRPAAPVPPQLKANKQAKSGLVAAGETHYGCAYERVCLYSDAGFVTGYKLSFYTCAFVDLGGVNFPTGGKWNDRMSAYVNNQTDGTTSIFYNWNGASNWSVMFSTVAIDWNSNVGSTYNDKMDAIRVC